MSDYINGGAEGNVQDEEIEMLIVERANQVAAFNVTAQGLAYIAEASAGLCQIATMLKNTTQFKENDLLMSYGENEDSMMLSLCIGDSAIITYYDGYPKQNNLPETYKWAIMPTETSEALFSAFAVPTGPVDFDRLKAAVERISDSLY